MSDKTIVIRDSEGAVTTFGETQVKEAVHFYLHNPGTIEVNGIDLTGYIRELRPSYMDNVDDLVIIKDSNKADIWNFDSEEYDECYGIEVADYEVGNSYEHCFARREDGAKIEFILSTGYTIGFLPVGYSEDGKVTGWTCCKDKTPVVNDEDGMPLLPY